MVLTAIPCRPCSLSASRFPCQSPDAVSACVCVRHRRAIPCDAAYASVTQSVRPLSAPMSAPRWRGEHRSSTRPNIRRTNPYRPGPVGHTSRSVGQDLSTSTLSLSAQVRRCQPTLSVVPSALTPLSAPGCRPPLSTCVGCQPVLGLCGSC